MHVVDELAMRRTGPDWTAILRHGDTLCCQRRPHGVGERAPVRPMQLPREVVSGGEFCANIQTLVSVCE